MKKNNGADLWVSMRNKSGRTNSSNSELAVSCRYIVFKISILPSNPEGQAINKCYGGGLPL